MKGPATWVGLAQWYEDGVSWAGLGCTHCAKELTNVNSTVKQGKDLVLFRGVFLQSVQPAQPLHCCVDALDCW